jgi:drug/metabolite transporter (DMT)-like permease
VTKFVRIWLPLAIAVAGVVLIVLGHGSTGTTGLPATLAGLGVGLLIAAAIVGMINWMFRMSVQSNREREEEERAREYFEREGRWPDE